MRMRFYAGKTFDLDGLILRRMLWLQKWIRCFSSYFAQIDRGRDETHLNIEPSSEKEGSFFAVKSQDIKPEERAQ
jgi:hypothetical protein